VQGCNPRNWEKGTLNLRGGGKKNGYSINDRTVGRGGEKEGVYECYRLRGKTEFPTFFLGRKRKCVLALRQASIGKDRCRRFAASWERSASQTGKPRQNKGRWLRSLTGKKKKETAQLPLQYAREKGGKIQCTPGPGTVVGITVGRSFTDEVSFKRGRIFL